MIHSVGVAELSRSAEVVSHSLHCVSTEVVVLACRLQCSHNHPTHHTATQSAACITDTTTHCTLIYLTRINIFAILMAIYSCFSALILLVGHQEEYPVCKKMRDMVICLE